MVYIFNYMITGDLNETLKYTFNEQKYSWLYILKNSRTPPASRSAQEEISTTTRFESLKLAVPILYLLNIQPRIPIK